MKRLCFLSTSIQKKLKLSTKLVDYFRNKIIDKLQSLIPLSIENKLFFLNIRDSKEYLSCLWEEWLSKFEISSTFI